MLITGRVCDHCAWHLRFVAGGGLFILDNKYGGAFTTNATTTKSNLSHDRELQQKCISLICLIIPRDISSSLEFRISCCLKTESKKHMELTSARYTSTKKLEFVDLLPDPMLTKRGRNY